MCAQMVKTVLGMGRAKPGLCLGNGRGKESGLCAPDAPTWVGLGRMAERENRGFLNRTQGVCPGWGGEGLGGQRSRVNAIQFEEVLGAGVELAARTGQT